MRNLIASVVGAALAGVTFCFSAKADTITVQTSDFISNPTYFNGFEGIGSSPNLIDGGFVYPSNTAYSEGGISVEYVGSTQNGGPVIHLGFLSGNQGKYGWYGAGGGYTDVTLTDGDPMQAIQFLASSGFGDAHPTVYLDYQLLMLGSLVSTGSIPIPNDRRMRWYGFSGGGFNEVRLQVLDGSQSFTPVVGLEAGAYDSFGARAAVTPLAPGWTMMLLGLASIGLVLNRMQSRSVGRRVGGICA